MHIPKIFERSPFSSSLLPNLLSAIYFKRVKRVSKFQSVTVPASSSSSVTFDVQVPSIPPNSELEVIVLKLSFWLDCYIGIEVKVTNNNTNVTNTVAKLEPHELNVGHAGTFITVISHFVNPNDSITISINVTNSDSANDHVFIINSMLIEVFFSYYQGTKMLSDVYTRKFIVVKTYTSYSLTANSSGTLEEFSISIPKIAGGIFEQALIHYVCSTLSNSSVQLEFYDSVNAVYVSTCTCGFAKANSPQHCNYCIQNVTNFVYDDTLSFRLYYVNNNNVDVNAYIWSIVLELLYKGV